MIGLDKVPEPVGFWGGLLKLAIDVRYTICVVFF